MDGTGGTGGTAGSGGSSGGSGAGGIGGGTAPFDPTFGKSGIVVFPQIPTFERVLDLDLDPAGRMYVSGYGLSGYAREVVRVLADGSIDTGFGKGGMVTLVGLPTFSFQAAAVQSDGKVLLGGKNNTSSHIPALVRLNDDGAYDASFGKSGYSALDLSGGHGRIVDLTVQGGRILAVGDGLSFASPLYSQALTLAMRPDGTLDTSFHTPDGFDFYAPEPLYPPHGDFLYAVHAPPDGSVYGCGVSFEHDFWNGGFLYIDFFVSHYLPDGSLDPSFGLGGAVRIEYAGHDGPSVLADGYCRRVATTPDGKIVIVGDAFDPGPVDGSGTARSNIVVARLLADGSPDLSFGDGGFFEFGPAERDVPTDLAVLPDGSMLVAGLAGPEGQDEWPVVALVRPDGTLAPEFGEGGIATITPPTSNGVVRLAVQADGKIVVSGTSPKPFVARLLAP